MVATLALALDLLAEAWHLLHSWFLSVHRYSYTFLQSMPQKLILLLSSSEGRLGTGGPVKLSILISLHKYKKDDSIERVFLCEKLSACW
jgi:hypothetical protein